MGFSTENYVTQILDFTVKSIESMNIHMKNE
jgi:hypothetical protein